MVRATFASFLFASPPVNRPADARTTIAFNQAVVSDPPFEAVVHPASPFYLDVQDIKKDLLDPGT
jgi:uncharacterized protein (DUF427 family)